MYPKSNKLKAQFPDQQPVDKLMEEYIIKVGFHPSRENKRYTLNLPFLESATEWILTVRSVVRVQREVTVQFIKN